MHWQEKVLQKYWHQVITLQIFINKSLFVRNKGKESRMLYQLSQKLYTDLFAYDNTTSVHCHVADHTMCMLQLFFYLW